MLCETMMRLDGGLRRRRHGGVVVPRRLAIQRAERFRHDESRRLAARLGACDEPAGAESSTALRPGPRAAIPSLSRSTATPTREAFLPHGLWERFGGDYVKAREAGVPLA